MRIVTYVVFSLPVAYLIYLVILYFRAHVPFVTTGRQYVPVILKEVSITPQTTIYDLGCGKGDFLFEAEKFNPKKLVGYELSFIHVWYSRIKALVIHSRVQFVCQDFFKADISDADLIYLFLVKPVLNETWKKIKTECKKGTVVLTLGDKIEGEEEIKQIIAEPKKTQSSRVWMYRV